MTELTLEQQHAIETIDQNMLVTAGAGSGKTMVLVRRFVEILEKQPHLSVKNLLAVTYTRKAAREMRTRIKSRLKELYEETRDSSENSKRNWQQSLSEMDGAHIETIHSLCQTILRSFAIHAGVDAHISLLEEVEQAQIIEETIEETLRQAIASHENDYDFVASFAPGDISDILKQVLRNHLQFSRLSQQLQQMSAEDLNKELHQLLANLQKQFLTDLLLDEQWRSASNYVANTPHADPVSELEKIRQAVASYAQSVTSSNWQTLVNLSAMDKPGNRGGRSESAVELRKQINVLIDKARDLTSKLPSPTPRVDTIDPYDEPSPATDITQYWSLWQSFLSMTNRALTIYKNKKRQLQKLDYDDLIAKTSEILSVPNSPVHRHYKETFSHILVDEFQDTNSVQAGLIKMLAGPETKLFFIGDDKQSIYKFQGADLATFNALRKEMNDDTAFAHSFRSTPAIVDFVNDIFSRLLHADFAHVDYRAQYRPLKAKRDNTEAASVEIVQLPVADRQEPNATPERIIEGTAVANWIKTKIESGASVLDKTGKSRPITYDDFAILVPNNSDFNDLESCLSQQGIPYVTSGGKTFLQRQEIYDMENILLFLSNPSDSHALLGILRSPMFALPDDLIHQLATNQSTPSVGADVISPGSPGPRVDCIDPYKAITNTPSDRRGGLHPPVFVDSRVDAIDPYNDKTPSDKTVGARFIRPFETAVSEEFVGASVSPPAMERRITTDRRGEIYPPVPLWQSLQSEANKNRPGFELVNEAAMNLKRLLGDMPALTLSQLIYRIVRDTNYDLTVLTLPDGKQRYKNIWKLYTLAAQKEDLTASEFANHLNLSRQLSVDLSNAAVDNGHSVKLMTIHAAKGLEFPAVALPRLSAKGRVKESKLLFHYQFGIAINTARGSFLNKEQREENTPLAYSVSNVLNKDMEIAEKKRLLYVAMTRARDYLGIFIKESDKKGEHAGNWLRPLIEQSGAKVSAANIENTGRLTPAPTIPPDSVVPIQNTVNSVGADCIRPFEATSSNGIVGANVISPCTPSPRVDAIDPYKNKNVSSNDRLLDDQIDDRLLEPVSAHTGIVLSPLPAEFTPRITPKSGTTIEPDHSLTGTYFHKLMEYLPQGKTTLPDEELCVLAGQMGAAAAHPQINQAFIEQGKKLLKIFASSELQSLLANAKTICHEWSYYIAESQKHDAKRPDLLLESVEGTWYLIDYKTDNFSATEINQQASRHRPQLERYGADFTALTGITPQLAIYFAQHGVLHRLDSSKKTLPQDT